MSTNKEIEKFFDRQARIWAERAYDNKDKTEKFPSSKVRHAIAISEIKKRKKNGLVLDMGCASGELAIDLFSRGFCVEGFDISPEMVNIANKNLKKTKAAQKNKKEIIFSVSDFDSYNSDKKFDVITAMGFSEYLPSDKPFFEKAGELLKKRGLLIVDFRNQLFNLTSANHFTEEIFEKKLGKKLIQELSEIKDLSPQKITESQKRIASVYKDIGKKMSSIKNFQIPKQKFKLISTQIDIRQSSPLTVKHEAEKAGFKLEYVVYFHFHPFPPMYEKFFPVIYNTIALQMQPLGYTPLGAPLCSSFVAVLTKK